MPRVKNNVLCTSDFVKKSHIVFLPEFFFSLKEKKKEGKKKKDGAPSPRVCGKKKPNLEKDQLANTGGTPVPIKFRPAPKPSLPLVSMELSSISLPSHDGCKSLLLL